VINVRDSTLSVVSAEHFTVTATIPTRTSPTLVTVLPDGRKGYVSDLYSGTLSVLDLTGRRRRTDLHRVAGDVLLTARRR
jgi:DNA-binding beta-propeller fold protein YncE